MPEAGPGVLPGSLVYILVFGGNSRDFREFPEIFGGRTSATVRIQIGTRPEALHVGVAIEDGPFLGAGMGDGARLSREGGPRRVFAACYARSTAPVSVNRRGFSPGPDRSRRDPRPLNICTYPKRDTLNRSRFGPYADSIPSIFDLYNTHYRGPTRWIKRVVHDAFN
jgi:hypothetical protein